MAAWSLTDRDGSAAGRARSKASLPPGTAAPSAARRRQARRHARAAPVAQTRQGPALRRARCSVSSKLAKRADKLQERLGDEHDLALLAARVSASGGPLAGKGKRRRRTRKALLKLIARRRKRLRKRALREGKRLYKSKPKRFSRRAHRQLARAKRAQRPGGAGPAPGRAAPGSRAFGRYVREAAWPSHTTTRSTSLLAFLLGGLGVLVLHTTVGLGGRGADGLFDHGVYDVLMFGAAFTVTPRGIAVKRSARHGSRWARACSAGASANSISRCSSRARRGGRQRLPRRRLLLGDVPLHVCSLDATGRSAPAGVARQHVVGRPDRRPRGRRARGRRVAAADYRQRPAAAWVRWCSRWPIRSATCCC